MLWVSTWGWAQLGDSSVYDWPLWLHSVASDMVDWLGDDWCKMASLISLVMSSLLAEVKGQLDHMSSNILQANLGLFSWHLLVLMASLLRWEWKCKRPPVSSAQNWYNSTYSIFCCSKQITNPIKIQGINKLYLLMGEASKSQRKKNVIKG